MQSDTVTRVGKNEWIGQVPEARADETIIEIRSCHKLVVISEDFWGKECVLADTKDKRSFMIGRSPECDIQLNDKGVSQYHAFISMHSNECILQDRQSLNGTFVNNLAIIPSKRLRHNDIIRIVDTVFMFVEKDKFVLRRNIKKVCRRPSVLEKIKFSRKIFHILFFFILILLIL
jgi:hypothetical protein